MIRFALSQEQIDIVERLVASGRYEAPDNVIGAALTLLETRERERRERLDCLTALHAALCADHSEPDAGQALIPELLAPETSSPETQILDAPDCDAGDHVDEPLHGAPDPFDAAALDEIERLIASKAPARAVA